MNLGLRGQCETGLGPDKLGLGLDKARLRGQCETGLGPDKLDLGAKQS